MMIQKTVMAAALALACTAPTQTYADQLEPGDTYIISRDGPSHLPRVPSNLQPHGRRSG